MLLVEQLVAQTLACMSATLAVSQEADYMPFT